MNLELIFSIIAYALLLTVFVMGGLTVNFLFGIITLQVVSEWIRIYRFKN